MNKEKIKSLITIICVILVLIDNLCKLVLIGMYIPFKDKILEARGLKENHCIRLSFSNTQNLYLKKAHRLFFLGYLGDCIYLGVLLWC